MNSFAETELRGQLAVLRSQVVALSERLSTTEGALLANTIAMHVLIAQSPDLDRTERNLRSALGSQAATAQPATAEEAQGFQQAYSSFLDRVATARDRLQAQERDRRARESDAPG